MQEVKPSGVVGVPRVYQRIYDRVIGTVNSSPWLRRNMFWAAYSYKKRVVAQGEKTPFL
jgi:long-subunit acyl-CoA synthetase (AMP-forming)